MGKAVTNFIDTLIAWALLCAAAVLLISVGMSFVALEWQWLTDKPFGRLALVIFAMIIWPSLWRAGYKK